MDSEFSALSDLAISKGFKHSDIISSIHDKVLLEYYKNYPSGAKDVEVVVDEKTGTVRLLSGSSDVTPEDFREKAKSIARKVIIDKIGHEDILTPDLSSKQTAVTNPGPSVFGLLFKFVFWGYNILFICYLILFLLGMLSPDFRKSVLEGIKNLGIFKDIIILLTVSTPVITMYLAAKKSVFKRARNLSKLFFFFEIPVVIFSILGLSILPELTPAMWLFIMFLYLIPVFLLFKSLEINMESPKRLLVTYFFHQSALIALLYITVLISFFTPLLWFSFLKSLVGSFFNDIVIGHSFNPLSLFYLLPELLIALPILAIIGGFSALPYLASYIFAKLYLDLWKKVVIAFGRSSTDKFSLGFALAFVLLIIALSFQPNINPYADKLKELSTASSYEAKEIVARELIPHEKSIKQAISDMVNYRNRYLFSKNDDFLTSSYEWTFNMDKQTAQFIQNMFSSFAYPFVYQGPTDMNQEIINNYQYLFGESPYDSSDTGYKTTQSQRAGEVKVEKRNISADTDYNGLVATISVEEEYSTLSWSAQEVIYEFSLPSDAVITDLKLGPNLEFPGVIAPKGAARQTYESEIVKRRDPALLEQTGPRQYRLRVYPIPGKNENTLNGKNQKVMFKYIVSAGKDGYALPVYFRKQNTDETNTVKTFSFNNTNVSSDDLFIKDPKTKASSADPCNITESVNLKSVNLPMSATLSPHNTNSIVNKQFVCSKNGIQVSQLANNLKVAVFYDTSYNNKDNSSFDTLKKALLENNFSKNNQVDLYLFNDLISQKKPVTTDISYFGKSDIANILWKFNGNYDFAIVVTGKDDNISTSNLIPANMKYPVYLVHTDGKIPPYGNKFTNYLYQYGGSSEDSIQEAINHFVISKTLSQGNNGKITVDVGPYWSMNLDKDLDESYFSKSQNKEEPTTIVSNYGPVGFWKFDESGGVVATDSSGNGNDGTLTKASLRVTNGKYNSAIYPSGDIASKSNYVDINNTPSLNITGPITLEAWIYPTSYPGNRLATAYSGIINKGGINTYRGYGLLWGNNTNIRTYSIVFNLSGSTLNAENAITALNQWYHIAGVYDGTKAYLYINGELVNSHTSGNPQDSITVPLEIGRLSPSNLNAYGFPGMIDEVKIYSYARSADQIRADMENREFVQQNVPQTNKSTQNNFITDPQDPLSYILAHSYIAYKLGQTKGNPDVQLDLLDGLNQFSVNNQIVTSYSSLIALVNEQQRQNLERNSQNYDRYSDQITNPTPVPIINPLPFHSAVSPLSGGLDFFGGSNITNLSFPKSYDSSAERQPIGISSPSNLKITSFGNLGTNLVGVFIFGNIVLIGGGIVIFLLVKLSKTFRKKK